MRTAMESGSSTNTSTASIVATILNSSLSENSPECKLYEFVVYTLMVGTICLLGLVGNVLSIIVFCQDKLKTSTSFLFQALAFIDSLLLISAFPLYPIRAFVEYTGGSDSYYGVYIQPYIFLCFTPFAHLFQTLTIWMTVLVGINRFIAVCKPYQAARLCTVAQARKQLILVSIAIIIYVSPRFLSGRIEYVFDKTINSTVPIANATMFGDSKFFKVVYNNIMAIIVLLVIPLFILTILNIRLINSLNELKRRRAEMQSARQRQDNNVTLVLIIVVIVFTICQVPALVNQIFWNVLPDASRQCGGFQNYYSPISNLLVLLNSAINFLIYLGFNTQFRHILFTTVCQVKYKSLKATSKVIHAKGETNETLL